MGQSDNIYISLTKKFNLGKKRAIITSGQAVVLYQLAIMSKDGDWIIREDQESLEHILKILGEYGAKYRFGAPLDLRWLSQGWSSHFEFNYQGMRVRTDFFSRPPRITSDELFHLWQTVEKQEIPCVDKHSLVKMKLTDRLKDYAVVGELCRLLPDKEQLLYSQSAKDVLAIKKRDPAAFNGAITTRPALKALESGVEALEEAIDKERRQYMKNNLSRIEAHRQAANPWAQAWPKLNTGIESLPLLKAHDIIVTEALKSLPFKV